MMPLERDESLAHRGATHPELGRELPLRGQPVAGRHAFGLHVVEQALHQLFVEPGPIEGPQGPGTPLRRDGHGNHTSTDSPVDYSPLIG
jgi:hypothetical protein